MASSDLSQKKGVLVNELKNLFFGLCGGAATCLSLILISDIAYRVRLFDSAWLNIFIFFYCIIFGSGFLLVPSIAWMCNVKKAQLVKIVLWQVLFLGIVFALLLLMVDSSTFIFEERNARSLKPNALSTPPPPISCDEDCLIDPVPAS